jgi:ketosteroid isomerase-like protein
MSQENVELVRRFVEAIPRDVKDDVEELLSYIDPEGELYSAIVGGAEGNIYRGHEGFRRWVADSFESFEEVRNEWTEFRDLGNRVLALGHVKARGRGSGMELDSPMGWVFTVGRGKVVKAEGFLSRVEALEAVENVQVVQASFEAWNSPDMDALREVLDPDAVMRAPEGWPEPGPFVGREAVIRQFEQMRETWDADASELISDFIDVGDRVAVRFIWRGTGHGPESSFELTSVNTVRQAKIINIEYFWDHAEALEAVGLSE